MAVRVKVCLSFIFYRANCHRASNSPDAGLLKKLVRDRNCRPALRGILETLLHYLTQILPKRTINNQPTEKPELEAAVQNEMRRPGQRAVVSKQQTQLIVEPAIVHFSPNNRLPDRPVGDCIPRRLTTFQLLQSKFMRSNPQMPITHQREVGKLNCFRGMTDLKHGQSSDFSVRKNQTRRGHGTNRAASVKDIVAKFALAEQKETGESLVKKQPIPPRRISRGTVLTSLMAKFEGMVTQCKGRDFSCLYESPSQEVKVTNRRKTGVDRQHQQISDQTVAKLETKEKEKQVISESTEVWIEGSSIQRQQERPELAKEMTTKISTNQEENMILAENCFNHKAESQCLLHTMRPQSSEKDIKRCTPEKGMIRNLHYEHEELIRSESVIENPPPEPCRAATQLEGKMNVHVGTITTCSPLWSKCVHSIPRLYSAETTGGLRKDHNDGLKSKNHTVGKIEGEDINAAKSETTPRRLPKLLIPRVQRTSPHINSLHQSEPHFENVNPSITVQQLDAGESVTSLNSGEVNHSSSDMTETVFHIIERDITELMPQHKAETAKEQQSIISNCPDIPQSTRPSDRMGKKGHF